MSESDNRIENLRAAGQSLIDALRAVEAAQDGVDAELKACSGIQAGIVETLQAKPRPKSFGEAGGYWQDLIQHHGFK